MSPAQQALRGRGIVITRPAQQAAALARLVEQAGGRALLYPMIEIEPVNSAGLDALIDSLEKFDLAIFISRNAVEQGLARVARRRDWPGTLAVAAVGGGTRAALESRGFRSVLSPPGTGGSESLLALLEPPVMNVSGRKIVIFRGSGGRELLQSTLRERGACVAYAECYLRSSPQTDVRPLVAAWARGGVHAIAVSSGEALANFAAKLGAAELALLSATPLFVPHSRVAEAARALNVAETIVAGPADADLVRGLVAYFGRAG